uniref:NTR domain-containing protein n=1 Tax=Meloidogyne enterolobii TaxID=390850 RepID=A0A6V7W5Z4_MELEN|nr:unnamed protein product [Meloidogyne enterolobii]
MSTTANKSFLIFSILILNLINHTEACTCRIAPPGINYCLADWVARVLVLKRQEGVKMPGSIDQQTKENVRYKVKYEQMFKISSEMTVTEQSLVVLPVNIYTSLHDSACGIQLELGHDYLLSGKYVNGTMQTSLCGQILLEDLKESRKHDILEWTEVPDKLRQQLNKQEFDSTCEKELN